MTRTSQRLPAIDGLKALACMMIIWHHLAFYGPMSDVLRPLAPSLIDWLYDYGRMAVQVFLVVGGFLAAASLAPQGVAVFDRPGQLILRRYVRLLLPLLVALAAAIAVAALVRPWLLHSSVPDAPSAWQLLSHLLLLQDLLGQEALSAGIWYVAIDFQLFVISVALFTLAGKSRERAAQLGLVAVIALAAASLFYCNRRVGLDITGGYFFGAYALGMLAWWASRSHKPAAWLLALVVLGGLALALDFRGRLALALLVALALVWLQRGPAAARWLQAPWLLQLGLMSYSVFLIHFPVLLLVNAVVSHFWPTQLLANGLGLLAAFGLSLLAGAALYRAVESPQARWRRPRSASLLAP